MSLITPLKKARGLGSAKNGTHHWWMQRVTAIALVPLTLWAAFSVASMAGESYEVVLTYFASPFNVAMFCLFLFTGFYHASLGLQVVIEDYIHNEGLKLGVLIGVKFALVLTGIMSIFAVLRTAFGS
ncbi:MAG: Succinate dehydrogenase hydrophobic membrane anchor protein [uncultured Thiotrichaceae bacterium]|uniref:Succinate dehydrogenase hydrophobic membrane anchor subunit n=1 Tax=uncultured Thiotrichaceae bacterium TaxID=298394 RepID=A0A6S6U9C1_9GAMM|nr:MAG: Succinate dehydrogenase hydrophobic membrane anchor protein [uncultured Thiotrichaceae bacterium]